MLITDTRAVHDGRPVDRGADVAALRAALPTLAATVVIDDAAPVPGALSWSSVTSGHAELAPARVPFDHPLWVLFSSGTTGRPKGIVHGHGGVVLEQLKHSAFHLNLRAGDRLLWYTTPSWMLWNSLVGALLVGATAVCYDGSPAFPRTDTLWDQAARLGVTVLGTSPAYLGTCRKAGVRLAGHDLQTLARVGVTGSLFPAELHRWLADELGHRVQVVSSSGGTDVVTAFVSATPITPVWAGELSAPCLGVALDSLAADGKPVRNAVGELVVRRPMPSMPVRFWNDPGETRYRDAYLPVRVRRAPRSSEGIETEMFSVPTGRGDFMEPGGRGRHECGGEGSDEVAVPPPLGRQDEDEGSVDQLGVAGCLGEAVQSSANQPSARGGRIQSGTAVMARP